MPLTIADRYQFDVKHPELAQYKTLFFGTVGTCIQGFPDSADQAFEHVFGTDTSKGCRWCQETIRRKIELQTMYEEQ